MSSLSSVRRQETSNQVQCNLQGPNVWTAGVAHDIESMVIRGLWSVDCGIEWIESPNVLYENYTVCSVVDQLSTI